MLEQGKHPLGLRPVGVGDVPAAHRQNEGGALHVRAGCWEEVGGRFSALGSSMGAVPVRLPARQLLGPSRRTPTWWTGRPATPGPCEAAPLNFCGNRALRVIQPIATGPTLVGPALSATRSMQSGCFPGPPARRVDRLSVREIGAEQVRSFRDDPDPGSEGQSVRTRLRVTSIMARSPMLMSQWSL